MTKNEIIRLFEGYPNNSSKVAKEVAEKIFNSVSVDNSPFIPLAGTGTNFVTGAIKVTPGGAVDFWNAGGTQQKVGLTYNADTLYLLGLDVNQILRITNLSAVVIEGSTVRLGQNGFNLGFFGADVPQQTVSNQATSTPTDLPTALTAINNLNTIINSLRTCLLTNGLLQVP